MAHPRSARLARPLGSPSRCRRLTATGAAFALAGAGLVAAAPAATAQAAGVAVNGATSGSALRLTVNLPGGEQTKIDLLVDPVTGQVRTSGSGDPQALAVASALNSSGGPLAQVLEGAAPLRGESRAELPEPTTAEFDPAAPFNEGIAGSPLANLLSIQLAPSSAAVTTAPTSRSQAAVANIGVGLPDAVAEGLSPVVNGLQEGIDALLTAIAENSPAITGPICENLPPAGAAARSEDEAGAGSADEAGAGEAGTREAAPSGGAQQGIDEVRAQLERTSQGETTEIADELPPMSGLLGAGLPQAPAPAALRAQDVNVAAASPEEIAEALEEILANLQEDDLPVLCNLSETLTSVNTNLQNSLDTLTGPGGVLSTGLVAADQAITRTGSGVTASATARVTALSLLGQQPFGTADVLTTTSTATATGAAGGAKAEVTSTVADLQGGQIDPFVDVRATLQGITGDLAGLDLDPLDEIIGAALGTLNAALAPIGVTVVALDDSTAAKAIESCPTELTSDLTGTFQAPTGACAAAATRGVGIEVALPEALATPLGIAGPLLSLQIVPTAALAQVTPIAPPPAEGTLPRTGVGSSAVAVAGLALLLGAAVVRRRVAG